ncbi:MAG: lipoyl(octanoyl) transferase LipB [Flavobacteriales bacterium]|jgi:lipoyl(octanoyl) transferase|nr:lipoyl(octanoyl) transferase LipB [Flavobacteriales bacterium]MBL6868679.1 lipoyl(octanoyl) transferase LipB [Flavobacteriales bacterium]|tara:strand:+ start:496 stop:1206 length:711 start_codon:yes stop_codon:yes gene_type:complete
MNQPEVELEDLGLIDYKQCWDYQTKLFDASVQLKIKNRKFPENRVSTKNHLIFCEHPHVYTLGKSGDLKNLLIDGPKRKEKNISFYKINRGGDITYHGPGQLVVYPILDLDYFFSDIHKYLRLLEESVILTLADYGVTGQRLDGFTGVWVDAEKETPRKICAIGVKCSRWVTMHGIGFNINSNLDYFKHIVPCGIEDKSVTSLQKEINQKIDMKELKLRFKKNFKILFGINWVDKK